MTFWFVPSLVTLAFLAGLAAFVYLRRPPAPLWPSLFFVQVCAALFTLGDLGTFFVRDLVWEQAWLTVLYAGIIFLPCAWWVLAVRFAEAYGRPLSWGRSPVVHAPIGVAAGLWVAMATNPWHGQFLTPVAGSRNEFHWLWWCNLAFSYLLVAAVFWIYARLALRAQSRKARAQVGIMLLAPTGSVVCNILYILWPTSPEYDFTVLGLAVASWLFIVGIYRTGLFSLLPTALRQIVDHDPDGMLLLDEDGRVLYANKAVQELFGQGLLAQAADAYGDLAQYLRPARVSPRGLTRERVALQLAARAQPIEGHLFRFGERGERWLRIEVTAIPNGHRGQLASSLRLRDITNYKRVSEAVGEQAAVLEAILASAHEGILVVDGAGTMIYYNGRFREMWGLTPEIVASGDDAVAVAYVCSQLVDPEGFRRRVAQLYAEPLTEAVDQIRLLDGRIFERSSRPLMQDGKPAGRVWSFRDVTAQRRNAEALAQSEAWHRAMFDSMRDALFTFDEHGVVRSWNPAAEQLFGWAEGDAVGQPVVGLIVPERYRGDFERELEAYRRTGDASALGRTTERWAVRRDGTECPIEQIVTRVTVGEETHFLAFMRDISERKAAERALRASHQRLRFHVDRTPLGNIEFDRDGRVSEWNAAAEEIFGYTRDEALGLLGSVLVAPGYEAEVYDWWQDLLHGHDNAHAITQNLHRDGHPMACEWFNTALRDEGGNVVGVACMVQDVTDRQEWEQRLARTARSRENLTAITEALYEDVSLEAKLATVVERVVDLFDTTTACVWLLKPGTECETCPHFHRADDGAPRCAGGTQCLQLAASAGRAPVLDAPAEEWLPVDAGVIGRLAANGATRIVTNDLPAEASVVDGGWAEALGLRAFAGYRLTGPTGETIGVLGVYSRGPIASEEADAFASLADMTGQMIVSAEATHALIQSEHRYRELVDNAPLGVISCDRTGRILSVNPQLLEMLGAPSAEATMQINLLEFPPLVEAGIADVIRRCFDTGEAETVELTYTSVWGRLLEFRFHAAPMRDAAGQISGVQAIVEDFSERKRTEQAVLESQQMLQLVLDSIPVRVFWKDRDLRYLGCNRLFAQDAGLEEPDELVGKTDHDLGWREQADLYRSDDWEVIETGAPKLLYEEPQTTPGGDWLWLRTSKVPLRDLDGNIIGVLGTYENITAQKQAEEALRESEEHYRLLADNAIDAIWAIDPKGRMTYISPACERVLGWQAEELLGYQYISRLFGDQMDDLFAHGFQEIMNGERDALLTEAVHKAKDGRDVPCEIHAIAQRDTEGRIRGFHGVTRDITERKQAEEALLHAQKLESLGVLAGGIAHDFNNLLVSVMGNAGLAMSELPPASGGRRFLEGIERAAERASELTQQLLAYSGKGQFLTETVDLNALVSEMTNLLDVSITKKATVRYRLGRGLPAVEVDPGQLRQVVMNLVINASDALGDVPGTIAIATGERELSAAEVRDGAQGESLEPGRYVYLEVTDTGCGMDEETQARIFDPFFSTKFTGRGLGLAAVLGIVRGHRGALFVESAPGAGSTFTVLLPASTVAAAAVTVGDAVPENWRGSGTILVVDDNPDVLDVASAILEGAGFRVLCAHDGQDGVATFLRHLDEIALVLLDMTMPRLSGEEALAEMRAHRPDVRVVLSSGFSEQEALDKLAASAPAAFIQKPYRPQALLRTMHEVLGAQADVVAGASADG